MANTKPSAGMAPGVALEPVLDAMLESMIVIDKRGIIETINRATNEMFGYEGDELVGQNINCLMTGSDEARHDAYLNRYNKTGEKGFQCHIMMTDAPPQQRAKCPQRDQAGGRACWWYPC